MVELPPLPPPRADRLARLAGELHQVLVVGGGVTGAGVALDLALRGVRTALVERSDWAGGTSSASSRLIHGGLRYLEQLSFGLVRESCRERGRLLRNAAGLVWPERFHFPLQPHGGVGRAKLAAGLALYTALSLPKPLGVPRLIGAAKLRRRIPGIDAAAVRGAGVYLDGATDDARLALAIVQSAMAAGALAVSRCEVTAVERGASGVLVRVKDRLARVELDVRAQVLVLAGGPFVDSLRRTAGLAGVWVEPTRGSHVLVPRERLPTDGAVIFASPVDGRVMFLIPWPRYTCIGTTDLEAKPEDEVRATRGEVRYLLESANGLVPKAALGEKDVLGTWAGLRPLLAAGGDPSKRSREERIEVEGRVVSVAGGKLTAYRAMAEKGAARAVDVLGAGKGGRESPTRDHRLCGALASPVARPQWSSLRADGKPDAGREPVADAWAKRYAAFAEAVREHCRRAPEGFRPLDAETLQGEIDWSVRYEDALLPSDFALRRTDVGYGSDRDVHAAKPLVLARMAEVLGWNQREREDGAAELESALARGRAWRRDPQ